MNWDLHMRLSLMMFLEFAIWGAWAPVLAAHLLDKLKFSGKQTGWVLAALGLACIVSPLVGGQIADRWAATEKFLAVAHLLGGVLLLVCAWQKSFWGIFGLMFAYSLLYAPTLALVNSLMFRHLTDATTQAGIIRGWGVIGWIVAGAALAVWRSLPGRAARTCSDGLVLAGILSLLMGASSFFLPHTPPLAGPGTPLPLVAALGLLARPDFLALLLVSLAVATQVQFHHEPTTKFLAHLGVNEARQRATSMVAHIAEVAALVVLVPLLLPKIGYKWALAIGVIAWPARYVFCALMRPLWLVISSLSFCGIGYAFLFFVGQVYADSVAPPAARASAQALVLVVTLGFGSLLGSQFARVIMDFFKVEGKYRWRPIFLVPCILTVTCAIAFMALFGG